jgi:osmotically-inducible protein OsmY
MERNLGRESFLIKEQSRYVGGWWGEIRDAQDDYLIDHQLRDKVRARLNTLPDIDPLRIEVLVFNSSVILGGTVSSQSIRDAVLADIKHITGVCEVHNGLIVGN